MTLYAKEKHSIRSSSSSSLSSSASSLIIHEPYHGRKSLLLSCCGCNRTRQIVTSEDKTKQANLQNGFFKRIQIFKAQKRQSSVRKQQLVTIATNGHLSNETEKLSKDIKESDHIENFQPSIDSRSLADIEIASSVHDDKYHHRNLSMTPKSISTHKRSSIATNLSAYSSQTLLRKLRDKAQVLDEYYQDISTKLAHRPVSSLSSSSSSLRDPSGATPRLFLYHHRSSDSMKKSQRRNYRQLHSAVSSDSSRFDLYDDEDNILRELVRFNNDIDLILSRLEMEGETLPQLQTTDLLLSEEDQIKSSNMNATDDSYFDINPKNNNNQYVLSFISYLLNNIDSS
ncbi:hypothetical protein I4U23_002959 [Adineta vaga]|nr:hypothetical protein I4U23_002959 [Adineta vaga]